MRLTRILLLATLASLPLQSRPASGLEMSERLACQRAIESVHWEHRIWPEENPGAKPRLSEVLPESSLVARVERGLLASAALETVWSRPLTSSQLAAEVERMAADSRSPDRLLELWAALDNDPVRVTECLARPLLAEHLARAWYATEERFHGPLRRIAEEELERARRGIPPTHGRTIEIERSLADLELDLVSPSGRLDTAAWQQHLETLGVAPGSRSNDTQAGIGSGFGPLEEDEQRFYAVRLLARTEESLEVERIEWRKLPFEDWLASTGPAPVPDRMETYLPSLPALGGGCAADTWAPVRYRPEARAGHTGSWTGSEMILWSRGDGHLYDPATDRWRPISRIGLPADGWEAVVWTGSRLLVWGGGSFNERFGGGGSYDPVSDTWTPITDEGAPVARSLHSGVWTGSEMIVWGGDGDQGALADGGRYDPAEDLWVPLSTAGAPTARHSHHAVWTGQEMLVWGGEVVGNYLVSGGRYDPSTDSWTSTSLVDAPQPRRFPATAWTGSRLFVWGGCPNGVCGSPTNTGALYDPASDTWAPTSSSGAPGGRRFHSAAWTGESVMVWGGCTNHDCTHHTATGGLYDPATDEWSPTATAGAPSQRSLHSAVWTGEEMLIWGGCNSGECQNRLRSGGRYDPASDSWVPLDTLHATRRINHTAVWTGAEMIVWGGWDGFSLRSGGRYSPALDTWLPMSSSPGGIDARDSHTAVWTGTEMIAWAGSAPGLGPVRTGARYQPTSDTWTETAFADAPTARIVHEAFWTGTEMLVWGGCAFQGCSSLLDSGGFYDPATNSWRPTSTADAPSGRAFPASVWTGNEMIVWGGWNTSGPLADGGRFDAASDTWTPIATGGAPTARQSPTAVWTGEEMIVWGGRNDATTFGDGRRYSPSSDTWAPVAGDQAPAARYRHTAEWSGREMIVFAGCEHVEGCWDRPAMADGRRYDPAADRWSEPLSTRLGATSRKGAVSVWTGEEMIVWGGDEDAGVFPTGGELDDGGRYCPGEAGELIFRNDFESGDLAGWTLISSP